MSAELDDHAEVTTDLTDQGDQFPEAGHSQAGSVLSGLIMEVNQPLSPASDGNGDTGRDGLGRFVPGNPFGFQPGHHLSKGNPLARRVALLRSELLRCSTRERMRAGVEKLWERFAAGDTAAAKLLLAYTLGEPKSLDLIESVVRLQGLVLRGVSSNG